MEAIIGIGANQGARPGRVLQAVRALDAVPGVTALGLSNAYETEPIGPPQPLYLNAALRVWTDWSPTELLATLHGIEAALGRRRAGPRWGPRPIDLDLLLAGDIVVDSPRLRVPHPRLTERLFALTPLLELAPEARDPRSGRRLSEIAAGLPDQGVRPAGPLPAQSGRRDLAHTADRAFSVEDRTLALVLERAALALAEIMFDRPRLVERERREIEVAATEPEEMLIELLGELPFLFEAEQFATKRVTLLELDRRGLKAAFFGEPLDSDEPVLTAVKAVTYHDAAVSRSPRSGRWEARVVVDL